MSIEKPTRPPRMTSKIFGHVYSTNGSPLKSAKIACSEMETRTLAEGFFIFNGLTQGAYKVTASLQGFKTVTKAASVREAEEVTLDFHLSEAKGTAKICGHIYDVESEKPVTQGGTVMLILPIANKFRDIDRKGYYEFENLPAGTYRIATSIPGYLDGSIALSVGADEIKTYDFFCKAQDVEEPPWG